MVPTPQQELFIDAAQDWLENARLAAKQIGARQGTFTIVEVLSRCPFPDYLGKRKRQSLIGGVLSRKHFRRVGYKPSPNPSRNGGVIAIWSLKGQPYEPQKWRTKEQYDTGD